jgi:cysteine desulfurase/selenocysteine lyase
MRAGWGSSQECRGAGVALRGGHHCTQPLMHKLGVESTARASFYFYNTKAEVDRFVEVVKEIQQFFAG